MKRFPKDCPRDCPHFHCWDLNIDDYTNVCDLMNIQIDDYDIGYFNGAFLPICPLEDIGEVE